MVGMHPSRSVDFIDIETTTGPDPLFSYGSIYMGRPTMIKDSDSDTPLPHVDLVCSIFRILPGLLIDQWAGRGCGFVAVTYFR